MRTCTRQSASELADAIRAGQLSASDVVEAQLDCVSRFNPALNALVTLDAERARERAREADRALARGEAWGPLHGVPITIKDSFDTAGLRTVSGYRAFAKRVPAEDASAVARLRAAGAIIIGKTNLPTLARGIQTDNPVFGRTNNPWDVLRTPGGSSGGAAAAIAAGLSCLDLGSDIGGSIRIPAHFCGVYSLKATAGRIAGRGHVASARPVSVPTGCEGLLELASFGPIARSLDDLELALPIVSKADTPPLCTGSRPALAALRLAWTDDFGGTPLDSDSRRLMGNLAAELERQGAGIEHRPDASIDYGEAWHTAGVCLGAIDTLFQSPLQALVRRVLSPLLSHVGWRRRPLLRGLAVGMSLDRGELLAALVKRNRIIDQLETFLRVRDAWLCPVFPTAAFTHRRSNASIEVDGQPMPQLEANLLHSIIFNLTGHPVVTIPVGLSTQGMPIGMQVIGRRWQEVALLHVARRVASVTSGYQSPPGY